MQRHETVKLSYPDAKDLYDRFVDAEVPRWRGRLVKRIDWGERGDTVEITIHFADEG
ncbi:hypothetical protein HMSP1_12 [Sinorhizobium phage HMSP1-Susan]|nr:hypothetical protein HMSP1_12 [Sinorhizobium phage HMSP1-Susan]